MKRTKAIAILEESNTPHEVKEFAAIEYTAQEVASQLLIPLQAVFKTLVVRGDSKGEALAVVPGDKELNLKKLAAALGDKRASLVSLNEIQRLTGYLKGGVSPLGGKRPLPVLIDESCKCHSSISISAGLRGLQIIIAPEELLKVTQGRLVDLT